jgi:hypothetical protein
MVTVSYISGSHGERNISVPSLKTASGTNGLSSFVCDSALIITAIGAPRGRLLLD